ncbi:MAG: tyrosine-protein phosphatase [Solirubrobacteraceae bacterium]|nr:tyrosine-protein phosphatase [Solirubrobacteraceae bacterium]
MRRLDWDGCLCARDLGGLETADGRVTRPGALVRSDDLGRLTPAGWAALRDHGITSAIDLRNDDEREGPHPIPTVHLPLDAIEDREFWDVWQAGPQFATPLYYRPHLERFPDRSAAVLTAIADAPPGGVVVHCTAGRDRTGLASLLVLALLGVPGDVIAADHELSAGHARDDEIVDAFLADRGETRGALVRELVDTVDVADTLRLPDTTVGALRVRLLSPRARP